MHTAKKHAYLDKEDRIMLDTKMVKVCLQTMLTMNLNNNNYNNNNNDNDNIG
jgi:hypothetical protein